jgi:predicted nucleic acid-binding protein
LLLEEDGTEQMRAAAISADRTISVAIAYVELRAALSAALRAGRIPAANRNTLAYDLERIWSEVFAIVIDDLLLRQAGDLAESLRLRAYDAVHLAALTESRNPSETLFACWDRDLRSAASRLGYAVIPAT